MSQRLEAAATDDSVATLRKRLSRATQEAHARLEAAPRARAVMPSRGAPACVDALPAWLGAVASFHASMAASGQAGRWRDMSGLQPLLRLEALAADLGHWDQPIPPATPEQQSATDHWWRESAAAAPPALTWFLAGSCAGSTMMAASLRRQGLAVGGWSFLSTADAVVARRLADGALAAWPCGDPAREAATIRAATELFAVCGSFLGGDRP